MATVTVQQISGEPTDVEVEEVERFADTVTGAVLRPEHPGYDDVRAVFNAMIDKRPALIVRCAGAADIIDAVKFARAHELLVAVRGGGHSVGGKSLCDNGMLIDLSMMKGIRVDPDRKVARAQPGLRLGEFDRETQAFGLATPTGVISDTGLSGLTLGGGMGWLNGKYGLAIDNLLSVDVVTAEGEFLTASEEDNEDLFWGMRGGAGNFGIATSYEYRLHEVDTVLGGMLLWPLSSGREVLSFYAEVTEDCPDELSTVAALLSTPDGDPVVGVVLCWCGDLGEGEKAIAPLRTFGEPVVDAIGPMSYVAMQSMLDEGWPPGLYHYWKSGFVSEVGDDLIDVLLEGAARKPSPLNFIGLQQIHGATARVAADATAFPHREDLWVSGIYSVCTDPADADANIEWTRSLFDAVQPHMTGGVYVNDMGEESDERVRSAYGANWERLATLKRKYDPTNFFRLNQNVPPEA